jgi:hypothetical protein
MVKRRIDAASFPNWRYAALDSSGKPIRKPYTPQPGEMSYEEYLSLKKDNLNNP